MSHGGAFVYRHPQGQALTADQIHRRTRLREAICADEAQEANLDTVLRVLITGMRMTGSTGLHREASS